MNKPAVQQIPIVDMPLTAAHYRVLAVSSMEQMIGAAQSALVGIVLPMIALMQHHEISSLMQGVTGAIGLIGIATGSVVIGRISDEKGYATLFRLCPLLIALGALLPFIFPHLACLVVGLFISGLGIGGGYSLDSAYISELMPKKWSLFMVGVAKATSSIGFIGIPLCCWLILRAYPDAKLWNWLMLLICALGVISLVLRLKYPDSPKWLMDKGRNADAQEAAKWFFGPKAEVLPTPASERASAPAKWIDMFRGSQNIKRFILGGIPWACEGVGVYGIGVFLPILVMALGIDPSNATGMEKIVHSVGLTTIINCFILPGFVIGLLLVRRCYHIGMMTWGFIFYSIGVGLVLAAYLLHWPLWVSVAGFLIFEVALNAGPHLITFIIPSQIYSIDERGAGNGVSAMTGKLGAIAGVFLMPVLLHAGGMTLVLIFCTAIGLVGALISAIFGHMVLPRKKSGNSPA